MATATKERPIVLRAWEVRAILDGRKSQTRRIMKPQPSPGFLARGVHSVVSQWPLQNGVRWFMNDGMSELVKSPYGQPGDRLWVRETSELSSICGFNVPGASMEIVYAAGGRREFDRDAFGTVYAARNSGIFAKAVPSVHMPRWASRITLEITGVRVERLQKISEADALADGGWDYACCPVHKNPERSFADLWESINGPGSWDMNSWVWVVEFNRVES